MKSARIIKNLEIQNVLTSVILLFVSIYAFTLYLSELNKKAEINYLRAFTKSIETKGLAHYNASIKPTDYKVAKVTAYSCGGISTTAQLMMNCPSLLSGQPKTANGTTPIPYKTMACDKSLMGKEYDIKGIGVVRCTDTGGAIKGTGRFDLYVYNIQEALQFGTQYIIYKEV